MYLKNYQLKIVIKRKSLKMFMIYHLSRGLRYVNAIQFREDKDDRETARIIWRVTQVAMSHINIDYILHVFILFIFTSLICTILVARRLIIPECVHRVLRCRYDTNQAICDNKPHTSTGYRRSYLSV